MSQSYFFALSPRFLKVQHSFAKTIKPNTKYRIMVFKGIQKCDQMKQPIKSKLVGGKIDIQSQELGFNIPYFSPGKNILFTVKLYEEKPNEEEKEIASYVIGSSDYIKSYKSEKQTAFQVVGQFQDDISIEFDLYVEKSKDALAEVVKNSTPVQKSVKEIPEDNRSLSGRSKQVIRNGDGFISPRRRIERKSGHQNRLLTGSGSRQKVEEKVSPKIPEPPKGKSIPKSESSQKSIGKQAQTKPEVSQKTYQYQPPTKLKYTDTKQIFDLQVQRNTSPGKSPTAQQVKSQKGSSPQNRASFTGPQTSQSNVSPVVKSPPVSPRVPAKLAQLQVKHTSNVFDIVQKKADNSPPVQKPKSIEKYHPKREPKIVEVEAVQQPKKVQTKKIESNLKAKVQAKSEAVPQTIQPMSVVNTGAPVQAPFSIQIGTQLTSSTKPAPQSPVNQVLLGSSLKDQSNRNSMQQSKVHIVMQGSVHEPKPQIISRIQQKQASAKEDDIQVKAKQVKREKNQIRQSSTLRGSLRLTETLAAKQLQQEIKAKEKSSQDLKLQLYYVIFLVVSAFLIYNAMMPTRRV